MLNNASTRARKTTSTSLPCRSRTIKNKKKKRNKTKEKRKTKHLLFPSSPTAPHLAPSSRGHMYRKKNKNRTAPLHKHEHPHHVVLLLIYIYILSQRFLCLVVSTTLFLAGVIIIITSIQPSQSIMAGMAPTAAQRRAWRCAGSRIGSTAAAAPARTLCARWARKPASAAAASRPRPPSSAPFSECPSPRTWEGKHSRQQEDNTTQHTRSIE